jgi:orotidine-5'-phosphate decarboxylase
MSAFVDRLVEQIRTRGNPVMVGLDPRWDSLPAGLRGDSPHDPQCVADSFERFCCEVVDVVAPLVPIVKPQAAFFEQWGPAGMAALHRVIQYARRRELLVVVDGKRNDIGSTAQAYAEAYLGANSPWGADALTVSPYLGDDSLEPFVQVCQKTDSGIFVLVKTSNPGGKLLQDLRIDGQPLYCRVAQLVQQISLRTLGTHGYGLAGAVVGATYPAQVGELRALMPNTWFLVPGYGTQGGTARDVADAFDQHGLGAVINNSRGIIFAHSSPRFAEQFGEARWQDAVAAATHEMIEQLQAETRVGRIGRPATAP